MPWKISKRDSKYCVVKKADNSLVACHDTRADAVKQLAALYASESHVPEALLIDAAEVSFGEMDIGDLRSALQTALKAKVASENGPDTSTAYCYVVDVFRTFIVSCEEKLSAPYQMGYWRRPYTVDGANVTVGDQQQLVEQAWVPALAAMQNMASEGDGDDGRDASREAKTKTDGGQSYGKSAFLITPSDEPSTWKIRVEESPGKVTVAQLGRAAAALTKGFRGNKVQASDSEIAAAKRKLRALYGKLNATPPDALKEADHSYGECRGDDTLGAPLMQAREVTEGAFSEAIFSSGLIQGVIPIRAGESANRNFYPRDVLKRDHTVFEGMPVFLDHQDPKQPKPLDAILGVLENVRWDDTAGVPRADLRYPQSSETKIAEIKEKHALLGPEAVGLSIDMPVKAKVTQVSGRVVKMVEALVGGGASSTDVVWRPAAGGSFDRAFEAEQAQEMAMLEGMTLEEIQAARPDLFPKPEVKADEPPAVPAAPPVTPPAAPSAPVVETKPAVAPEMLTRESVDALVNERVQAMLDLAAFRAAFEVKVREAKIPDRAKDAILREAKSANYDGAACESIFTDWCNIAAAAAPPQVNVPGSPGGAAKVTGDSADIRYLRLLGAAEGKDQEHGGQPVRRFHSLKEAILAFHPEMMSDLVFAPSKFARESLNCLHWGGGELGEVVGGMTREAIVSTTFSSSWADVMFKMLYKAIADPALGDWRQIVSDQIPFSDLTNTRKIIRVGDYPNLSAVNEGAPYQLTTSPTEEQVTFTVGKYGNLETYTWEAALRDDLRVLARIPGSLGRAWAWTVHDFIWALLQANTGTGVTMDYDSTVLYHANHNNIATSAFTAADLITASGKMRDQTDISSGHRKAYRPKFLAYAFAESLRQSVWEALNSMFKVNPLSTSGSQVNLPNMIEALYGLTPLEVIYPGATTTRWEVIADPADAGTIAVGFLNGNDMPEIFVQDMERVGSVFNADVITYKIRGTVGADVLDHRAFCRGNL